MSDDSFFPGLASGSGPPPPGPYHGGGRHGTREHIYFYLDIFVEKDSHWKCFQASLTKPLLSGLLEALLPRCQRLAAGASASSCHFRSSRLLTAGVPGHQRGRLQGQRPGQPGQKAQEDKARHGKIGARLRQDANGAHTRLFSHVSA